MCKKIFQIFTIACVLILSCFCFSKTEVSAESVKVSSDSVSIQLTDDDLYEEEEPPVDDGHQPTFEGLAISSSVITDTYLYEGLLRAYKLYYVESTSYTFTGTTIYSDMFKDFVSLNLDNLGIASLDGMDRLDLDKLQSFSANNNSISSFNGSIFGELENNVLTSLSLANNNISSVNISNLIRLSKLDLSSNSLTSLNLEAIEGRVANTEFELNVAGNSFTTLNNITLPSRRIGKIKLNIIGNDITTIPDAYFDERFDLQIGVQGFEKSTNTNLVSVDTATKFKFYKTNNPDLGIEIYKIDEDLDRLITTVYTKDIAEGENYKDVDLSVGEYRYDYVIDGLPAYDKNDIEKIYLISRRFSIIPQSVSYNFTFKGKTYEKLDKVTGKVVVNLSTNEEDAKILYSVNGGEWKEGNTIECNDGGNYTINAKVVKDGVESKVVSIWVRTSLNLYIPDSLMLVIVLLITLVLFLVVVPIISKKFFKKG